VDTGLDQNETELGVLVLAVALKVLADGHSLGLRISFLHAYVTGREFEHPPS
jgi:hypothetical protein